MFKPNPLVYALTRSEDVVERGLGVVPFEQTETPCAAWRTGECETWRIPLMEVGVGEHKHKRRHSKTTNSITFDGPIVAIVGILTGACCKYLVVQDLAGFC
jgi:hypothetical protein